MFALIYRTTGPRYILGATLANAHSADGAAHRDAIRAGREADTEEVRFHASVADADARAHVEMKCHAEGTHPALRAAQLRVAKRAHAVPACERVPGGRAPSQRRWRAAASRGSMGRTREAAGAHEPPHPTG